MQPTPLPPGTQTSALREELRRERADRILRGIFCIPADASAAPAAGPVGPLGSPSFVLPTGRAWAGGDGGRSRVLLVQLLLRVPVRVRVRVGR